ncbi:hypothetical protein BDB01DRAFT_809142 [Pilobolus umbonatus]|nr:hypothetical protein BDB01DRAFT_809142 [Pilobolus umbonatus]
MLVLYHYGGVWFDMNTLFVRDLSPLLEHEWMAQGDCFTSMFGNPFTGGLFHFHVKSPYVCELLTGATDVFIQNEPDDSKEVFGSALYYRIYRRLLHHKIHPWSILPWCYTSPQCRKSNSLPSLFAHVPVDRKKVEAIFAYHSKEQWTLSPGSLFQYIDNAHKNHTLDT